jgi:hypothetical protein
MEIVPLKQSVQSGLNQGGDPLTVDSRSFTRHTARPDRTLRGEHCLYFLKIFLGLLRNSRYFDPIGRVGELAGLAYISALSHATNYRGWQPSEIEKGLPDNRRLGGPKLGLCHKQRFSALASRSTISP